MNFKTMFRAECFKRVLSLTLGFLGMASYELSAWDCEYFPDKDTFWQAVNGGECNGDSPRVLNIGQTCTLREKCTGRDCVGEQSIVVTNVTADSFALSCERGHWKRICSSSFSTDNFCKHIPTTCLKNTDCGPVPYTVLTAVVGTRPSRYTNSCVGDLQGLSLRSGGSYAESLDKVLSKANSLNQAEVYRALSNSRVVTETEITSEDFLNGLAYLGAAPSTSLSGRAAQAQDFLDSEFCPGESDQF